MFVVNDDLSIYATRGDIVCLNVSATDDLTGEAYEFQPGDIVRMKIFAKKNAEDVVLQKDFPVVSPVAVVSIMLTEADTKFGGIISKPTDYWYEIELNPFSNPQTIVGYDEDGAKIFKLFPEGKDLKDEPTKPEDIPVVDEDLDLTSSRPVVNRAISRAITLLNNELETTNKRIQENKSANKDLTKRFDNLISADNDSLSQNLEYIESITEATKAKVDGHISSDGVFGTVTVNWREANQIYGGTTENMFIIPNNCRPAEVGLIHTEDGMEYRIEHDGSRYYMAIGAKDSVTVAPSEAGAVTFYYALGNYELKDIRLGADGVAYETAGESIREQNKKLKGGIADGVRISSVSTNLFDKTTANLNRTLNASGGLDENEGWATSDFMDVGGDVDVFFVSPRYICEYDVLKNIVAGTFVDHDLNKDPSSLSITTNANTRYVRYSFLQASIESAMCKLGATETPRRYPYAPKMAIAAGSGKETYCDNVVNSRYEVKPFGNQLLDKDTISKDSRLTTNGSIQAAIGWNTSDYIMVDDRRITVSKLRYIHQYDKYKEPIVNSYVDLEEQKGASFELDANTRYIRISAYGDFSGIMVNRGEMELSHEKVKYGLFVDGKLVYRLTDFVAKEDIVPEMDYANIEMRSLQIISNFDDGSWVQKSGSSMSVSELSTRGTASVKTSSSDGANESIAKAVSLDLTNKVIHFKFYVENVANLSMLQLFFGSTGISDYYGWYPAVATLKNGWNTLTVTTDSFSPKNADTDAELLKNVKEIRIMNKSKTGVSSVISFDNISFTSRANKRGKVILQFDDQWDGVWKYAKPIMDKYGFRGVIYTIKDLVGVEQFMTLEQLKICYENGWDVGTHGQVELTTLATKEAIRDELLKNRNYLTENGFVRSACHYCSPAGKYNDMSLAEIKQLFKTHRTTKWGYNTLPTDRRYELFNISGNESELSYLQAVVDNAEKNKCLAIMNWHQIVETPTGNESMKPALKSTFESFIGYLASKDVDVVTLSDIFDFVGDSKGTDVSASIKDNVLTVE